MIAAFQAMRLHDLGGPVASSLFAGILGAGVVDGLVTVARSGEPSALGALLALGAGLYGLCGLAVGPATGWLVGGVLGAIPGGPAALLTDVERDRSAAAGVLAGAVALAVLCVAAAAGQALLIGRMESQKLAIIAAAGVVVMAAPAAALLGVGLHPALRRLVISTLPRSERLGTTGLLVTGMAGGGLLLGVAALSRADWRALDLGPLTAIALAVVLSLAHGIFWFRSAAGSRLRQRLPGRAIQTAVAATVLVMAWGGGRVPGGHAAYASIDEGALGMRLALRMARRATDGDGDGFSARFGGGDCDDRRTDTFPGGDDIAGDGIDQNCEGGDARVVVEARVSAPPGQVPTATAGPRFAGNILMITIDALRADRLGIAGYARGGTSLTPTLDDLAKRGAYFKRVWAQAPNTPRSFPAIVTSRYPSDVAWQKQSLNYSPILPSNETVFDHLAHAGLKPIGIFSHFYFSPDRGINKGFAEWSNDGAGTISESNKDIASPRIVPRVIARLRKAAAGKERFVLWTHLFEPHSSYMTHREFPASQTGVAGLMEKYDFEIAYVDQWVGKLLAALRETGLADTTAVVVMADHGEAWGEHKAYFHGQDLFDEQLRVPLIIAVPGRAPVVVDDRVALVDVAPTLLDLVGAPVPAAFRGRSVLPLVVGQPRAARPVFAELLPATAWPHHAATMVDGDRKLIHRISERRYELYDLAADPGEKKNLAADPAHKDSLEGLKAKLLDFEEKRR